MSATDKVLEHVSAHIALQGDRIRAELAAGLKETLNAVRLQGARLARIVPNATVSTSPGRLVGWTIKETSGTNPATVTIYDGRDSTGEIAAVVTLDPGKTANHFTSGVSITEAAFVTVAGAVVGSLYFGAVD